MQKQLQQMQQMQRQMEALQAELEERELTATAGGGAVSVTVNGKREIVDLTIDKEVVDPEDVEMLQDLIIEINEAGYFTEEVDGHKKNIVLQLEPGSILPEDDFLANMSASTQQAVSDLSLGSQILMIGTKDHKNKTGGDREQK